MNDTQREEFVMNDEGLYDMWKRSKKSKRTFIRENRAAIDDAIEAVASGKKRQHHLKYGP